MVNARIAQRPFVFLMAAALVLVVVATATAAEPTGPFDFFREGIANADSASQRVGVAFITVVLVWLSLGRLRLLLPIVLVAIVATAVRKPAVRRSRLVQAGFAVLLLGLLPLLLAALLRADNVLGAGMLFAFSVPVGLVIITAGMLLVVARNGA